MHLNHHSPEDPSDSPNGPRAWSGTLVDPAHHHEVLLEIADALHGHDAAALARLSAAERADQLQARRALQDYLIAVWAAPKLQAFQAGLSHDPHDPVHSPGASSCVAGLVALADALVEQAARAQADAKDPAGTGCDVPVVPCDRFVPELGRRAR